MLIPGVVSNQTIRSVAPTDSIEHAARLLLEHDISAVVVIDENEQLIGIVTERDMARRVVAENRRASETTVGELMSTDVQTLPPAAEALEALERMRINRIRHLPIVEDHRVVGMVSMRDLRQSLRAFEAAQPIGLLTRLTRKLRF